MHWRATIRNGGVAIGAITLLVAVWLRDVDAALLTALIAASLLLLSGRRGALGVTGLTIAFLLTGFWCVAGAIVNFSRGSTFAGDALTSVLGVLALAGLAAALASAAKLSDGAARWTKRATGALVVIALIVSFVASRGMHSPKQAGDIHLVTRRSRFVPLRIEAHAGRIAIDVTNNDFFWHTFTVDKLHLNLNVATRGRGRIAFDAPRGMYTFVCLIHAEIGMKGTLVVR